MYVVESCCVLGRQRILCESNSQVVVTLLNEQPLDDVSWHLAFLIRQIIWLCGSLEYVTFIYIPREWNGVVDCLAKWASEQM